MASLYDDLGVRRLRDFRQNKQLLLVLGILFAVGALGMTGMAIYTLITKKEIPGAVTEVGIQGDTGPRRRYLPGIDKQRNVAQVKDTKTIVLVAFGAAAIMALLSVLFLYLRFN
jgi:hypothetical protein